jgi:dihydrofolate reductase
MPSQWRALLEHALVDELRLIVYPFVLGAGERLFGDAGCVTRVRLVDTRTVGDGSAALTCQFAR